MKFIFFMSIYNIVMKYDKLYHTYINLLKKNNFKISIILLILFLKVFSYIYKFWSIWVCWYFVSKYLSIYLWYIPYIHKIEVLIYS